MSAHDDSNQNPGPQTPTVTLDPILKDGPDALDTQGDPNFDGAKLCRLEYASNDRFNEVTSHQADDLHALADTDPDHRPLAPAGVTGLAATLKLHKKTSGTTTAELRPPNTIKVEPESDTQIFICWLAKTPMAIIRKASQLAPLFVLALATLFAPVLDDFDDDDDDGDEAEECITTHHHHRQRFHVSRFTFHTRPLNRLLITDY
jgi:hypothetical protein